MRHKVNKRDHHWELASREFVRAVRGKRSQRALCLRLGYKGKPVADWERGRRFPSAATLLQACAKIGIDIPRAMHRFHAEAAPLAQELDSAALARWLNRMRANIPIVALSERSGYSRFSVSRWLSGQSQPRFPQFFALLDAITVRASDFIAELVDIDLVPTLRGDYKRLQAHRQAAYEEPWTAAVQRALETEAYLELPVHIKGWIASYLGVTIDTEERCLSRLQDAGIIIFDSGKFRCDPSTVDTRRTAKENLSIKAHWCAVAAQRLPKSRDGDLFAYNVVSASREDCDKIEAILRSAYREISSLVTVSEPQQEVALIQVQMMRFRPPE